MHEMLKTLLWEDPELPKRVEEFCAAAPGYLEAKREYDAAARRIAAVSGIELYDRFERSLFRYTEYEVRAYYLFGLGLRQALLDALN